MADIVRAVPIVEEQAKATQGSPIITWILSLLLIVGLIVLFYFLYKFLVKRKTERLDIYKNDLKTVKKMCKMQKSDQFRKSFLGLAFLKIGAPVMLVHPSLDPVKTIDPEHSKMIKPDEPKENITRLGRKPKLEFTSLFDRTIKIGRYKGHCSTRDGAVNLLVSSNIKRFLIFREEFVIKLRKGVFKKIIMKDKNGNEKEEIVDIPPDVYSMGSDMIIIQCLNLEQIGEFLYPVNVDKDGRIVDNRTYVYYDKIGIANERQMTQFGKSAVYAMEEAIRINPYAQWSKKVEQETIRSAE